jgi:two-component system, OmpR family, sensor histidine kinase BaeS
MLRTLRSRLILSHILPLVILVPLMYVALSYLLETRFLIPKLAQDLLSDARLLTDISRAAYLSTGDLAAARISFQQLDLNPQVRLVLLAEDGSVLYSNDPNYQSTNERIQLPGWEQVQEGEDAVLTNYSFLPGKPYSIETLAPVFGASGDVIGVLWLTYYEAELTRLFQQMRLLSTLVMLGSLLIGTVLGSLLAVSIARPVRQATQAIDGLARGDHSQPLVEKGPQEIRDLLRSVNVLVTRLYSLEQSRRQLLANLVHELGRPLGALRSAIQALSKGAAQDPQLLDDLATGMDGEAARLQRIVEDLAHLHDQVLGTLELDREPTLLQEWLPGVLVPWQEAAAEKRLAWTAELPADLPVVEVDQMRFAQVIGNLASNAVKYTPAGGSVSVDAGQEDGQVWVRFSDSGPGIPPDEQENIFLPFYRSSSGKRIKQGMGLGLSIARDLVTAHGGHISLESSLGAGSRFTVWLPQRS